MKIGFNPAIKNINQQADPQIKAQLEALGLTSTGSKEADLEAIKKALEAKKPDNDNKIMPPPQTPLEIAAFMRSIGVEPTNSKEGDALVVENRIRQLESQATSPAELDKVQNLKTTWEQLTASASSGGTSFQQQSSSTDSFAGQNQLAKINKWFLVN